MNPETISNTGADKKLYLYTTPSVRLIMTALHIADQNAPINPCIPNNPKETVVITLFYLRYWRYIQHINVCKIPATLPTNIAKAGFVMYKLADATAIPPEIEP